jgi:sugar phosphate isomerase/epimerase
MSLSMSLGPSDLILSYYSMVNGTFEERCIAAQAGGFVGFGLTTSAYAEERAAGRTDTDLERTLRDYDVRLLQAHTASWLDQADARRELECVQHLAQAFYIRYVHATVTGQTAIDDQRDLFRYVCDGVDTYHLPVAIEFTPFVPTVVAVGSPKDALAFIERSGCSNAGLVVDTYHLWRGERDWSVLRDVPADRIVSIEVTDAAMEPVEPDYLTDTQHHRLAPGQGELDLVSFVRMMDEIGCLGPYTVQVLNDELRGLPPAEFGRLLGDSTRTLLAQARSE